MATGPMTSVGVPVLAPARGVGCDVIANGIQLPLVAYDTVEVAALPDRDVSTETRSNSASGGGLEGVDDDAEPRWATPNVVENHDRMNVVCHDDERIDPDAGPRFAGPTQLAFDNFAQRRQTDTVHLDARQDAPPVLGTDRDEIRTKGAVVVTGETQWSPRAEPPARCHLKIGGLANGRHRWRPADLPVGDGRATARPYARGMRMGSINRPRHLRVGAARGAPAVRR